jgi:demethylmenaquinone methyltransferase / 2-methoxy-6-polyprenyl-1,4-benzoquinol methylase
MLAQRTRSGRARVAFQIGSRMDRDASPLAIDDPARETRSARKLAALDLFSGLPRRYDALSAAFSFGQDPRWRRALVLALAPAPGARVLDVATGTGMVAAELLARHELSVVAIDQSAEMLGAARRRFAAGGEDVELIEAHAESLPFASASFDALTFTYLLRYVDDPAATMRELARVLRPGGRIASLEFGVPPWAPARAAWRLYTAVGLPLLGRAVSRDWYEVGRFLGPNIREFYARHPLPSLERMWRDAGFVDVDVRRMSFGGGVVMSASRERNDASGGG